MGNYLDSFYRQSVAIIIGIGDYKLKKFPPLPNYMNDVNKIKGSLEKLGFKINEWVINDNATKERIERILFLDLSDETKYQKEDRVVIYYTGHGYQVKHNIGSNVIAENFLVPFIPDGENEDPVSFVDMENIVSKSKYWKPKQILLIIDSCYAGALTKAGDDTDSMKKIEYSYNLVKEYTNQKTIEVMAATEENQKSAAGIMGISPFTFALTNVLNDADLYQEGIVTAGYLFKRAWEKFKDENKGNNPYQTPVYDYLTSGGNFVVYVTPGVEKKENPSVLTIPGKILDNKRFDDQNDLIFEKIHLFSAYNLLNNMTNYKPRIGIISDYLPLENYFALGNISIKKRTIKGGIDFDVVTRGLEDEEYRRSIKAFGPKDESFITSQICSLIASPKMANNYKGLLPDCELFVYSIGPNPDSTSLIKSINNSIQDDIKILLINFGAKSMSKEVGEAIRTAYSKNISVVCPVTMTNLPEAGYPASFEKVVSVCSTDKDNKKSIFSSYGQNVTISSYGENIIVPYYNDWLSRSGTIFAASFVTATIGLMLQCNSKLVPDEIMEILKQSSDDINIFNPDYSGLLGAGKLNIYKAIKSVIKNQGA